MLMWYATFCVAKLDCLVKSLNISGNNSIMTFIRIPILGILGFVFGCCVTVIIALLFIPAREFWPSTYEDRRSYTKHLTLDYHFTFLPALQRLDNSFASNRTYINEMEHLKQHIAILCYSIEQEADNEAHARLILDTWAQHCDRTVMFYTSLDFLERLHPKHKKSRIVDLVYVDTSNSTIEALFNALKGHLKSYHWFTYVPPKVFLMPNNLRYFIASSKLDSNAVTFAGRPDIGRLTATWAVSLKSPLVMSAATISLAVDRNERSCLADNIEDPSCIIEVTGGKMLDMRDAEGLRLITQIVYGNLFVSFTNINVQDTIQTRFPVSIYVKGNYKFLLDLEYYFHHLDAFGHHAIQGEYIKLVNQTTTA